MTGTELASAFDGLMARAGVVVPPERRASLLAAFADLHGQLSLLHAPRSHLLEPATVFRLASPAPQAPTLPEPQAPTLPDSAT